MPVLLAPRLRLKFTPSLELFSDLRSATTPQTKPPPTKNPALGPFFGVSSTELSRRSPGSRLADRKHLRERIFLWRWWCGEDDRDGGMTGPTPR